MFAVENPALFALMFRDERLDAFRPSLVQARSVTFGILGNVSESGEPPSKSGDSLNKVGSMTATWAFVHGLSILAIEGRIGALLKLAPPGDRYNESA